MPTVLRFAYAAFAGEATLNAWVERVRYFYFIGSWGNPIIYAMINKGFRDYFKSFVNRLCRIYVIDPTASVGKAMSVMVDDKTNKLGSLRRKMSNYESPIEVKRKVPNISDIPEDCAVSPNRVTSSDQVVSPESRDSARATPQSRDSARATSQSRDSARATPQSRDSARATPEDTCVVAVGVHSPTNNTPRDSPRDTPRDTPRDSPRDTPRGTGNGRIDIVKGHDNSSYADEE